jgi:hypothetical protein
MYNCVLDSFLTVNHRGLLKKKKKQGKTKPKNILLSESRSTEEHRESSSVF